MSENKAAAAKVTKFFKKYGYYFLIALCVAAVATMIALAVVRANSGDDPTFNPDPGIVTPDPDDNKDPDPVPKKQTFTMPVAGGTVTAEFDRSALVFNATLRDYGTHEALDIASAENASVMSVCEGTVTNVGYDYLNGYYVEVAHENGYVSKYYSLTEDIQVSVGDVVTETTVLGYVGDTMTTEMSEGAHLHLVMTKDGVKINPLSVIVLDEK